MPPVRIYYVYAKGALESMISFLSLLTWFPGRGFMS